MKELSELHPALQLDAVLSCLIPIEPPLHSALEIVDDLNKMEFKCNEVEVIFILEKLMKDGFVTREIREITFHKGTTEVDRENQIISITDDVKRNVSYYLISFEGKTRIQYEGGYYSVLQNQKTTNEKVFELEHRQDRMANRLFWINLAVAVGTSIAAIY